MKFMITGTSKKIQKKKVNGRKEYEGEWK